jgi:hypothetical protein
MDSPVSITRWQTFARERLTARSGDVQAAWLDVINAAVIVSRLEPYRRAERTVDAAIRGFQRAHTALAQL